MATPAEYRVMADECFQWARVAKTKNVTLSLSRDSKDMACGGDAPGWEVANALPSH
jgi:hypothetical protein